MRSALILPALAASLGALSACGSQPEPAGPERRNAAGEVLGGEVTDDMLPLATVRSTSPADPRVSAESAADVTSSNSARAPLTEPSASEEPEQRQPAAAEPADEPSPE